MALPADTFVIGQPVVVTGLDYDGNPRRGVTARCRREDGSEHVVSLADVRFGEGTAGARGAFAYRRWVGIRDVQEEAGSEPQRRRHKATDGDIGVSRVVELVILSVKERAARCRLLGSQRAITLPATRVWNAVPGEIVTVRPRKHWRYAGHPYLSGDIESRRVDAAALGLVALRLEEQGLWAPKEGYWGEPDTPIEAWAQAIIARGLRPQYEMEQVVPGADPGEPDLDPIVESVEMKEAGDSVGAREILMEGVEADARCLDGHAHLGNLVFEHSPKEAIRHYEVGMRIGELSFGSGFDGVLAWGFVDNRPFLRCLHGYGLCLWRLDRPGEAAQVFERMLWMNPADNQGIRFLVSDLQAASWTTKSAKRPLPVKYSTET